MRHCLAGRTFLHIYRNIKKHGNIEQNIACNKNYSTVFQKQYGTCLVITVQFIMSPWYNVKLELFYFAMILNKVTSLLAQCSWWAKYVSPVFLRNKTSIRTTSEFSCAVFLLRDWCKNQILVNVSVGSNYIHQNKRQTGQGNIETVMALYLSFIFACTKCRSEPPCIRWFTLACGSLQ